jgi:fumarate reductase flavoprotein subunit
MHKIILVFILSVLVAGSLVLAQENQEGNAPAPSTTPGAEKSNAKESSPFYSQTKPFLGERHVANGLECSACHGEGEKKDPVKSDKCLTCHTSFEEVAKQTMDWNPNPHSNHVVESGDVECTSCHHGHKPSEVFCHSCHADMKFERKAADAK